MSKRITVSNILKDVNGTIYCRFGIRDFSGDHAIKLNAFHLKVISLVLMLVEHIGRYLPELFPQHYPLYFEYAGRLVAPIFIFLAVESFHKTGNRRKYILRLFTWALGMQIGNIIISQFVKIAFQPEAFFPIGQNIFLSLAVGVSMITAWDWARTQQGKKKFAGWVLAGLLAFASLLTEASYNGLLMFIVFYAFYGKKPGLYFAYSALSIFYVVWGLNNAAYFWEFEFQWMMISALPLIALYNGERGRYSLKYLFYAIYPLHIWILYLLRSVIG